MTSNAHVAILMATWNGAQYLQEQLDSIAAQTHKNWTLWISDDGSTDGTLDILRTFAEAQPAAKVRLTSGPRRGAVPNFMSLLCNTDIQADYYAFADQDDIWLSGKLAQSIDQLLPYWINTPVLVGNRTIVTDVSGNPVGVSPLFQCKPSFANALVQSIAGGNTMLFNRHTRDKIVDLGQDITPVAHDWWMYIIVSGMGGIVLYDAEPNLLYRQHPENVIGANIGWKARWVRIKAAMGNRFKNWNDINIAQLETCRMVLTPENERMLDDFITLQSKSGFPALWHLWYAGFYRQTLWGTLSLAAGAFLGKV